MGDNLRGQLFGAVLVDVFDALDEQVAGGFAKGDDGRFAAEAAQNLQNLKQQHPRPVPVPVLDAGVRRRGMVVGPVEGARLQLKRPVFQLDLQRTGERGENLHAVLPVPLVINHIADHGQDVQAKGCAGPLADFKISALEHCFYLVPSMDSIRQYTTGRAGMQILC